MTEDIIKSIKKCESEITFSKSTPEAVQNLIKKMLKYDENERIDIFKVVKEINKIVASDISFVEHEIHQIEQ